jgi:hypothetical protein
VILKGFLVADASDVGIDTGLIPVCCLTWLSGLWLILLPIGENCVNGGGLVDIEFVF